MLIIITYLEKKCRIIIRCSCRLLQGKVDRIKSLVANEET